jgi:hypothetical protein
MRSRKGGPVAAAAGWSRSREGVPAGTRIPRRTDGWNRRREVTVHRGGCWECGGNPGVVWDGEVDGRRGGVWVGSVRGPVALRAVDFAGDETPGRRPP